MFRSCQEGDQEVKDLLQQVKALTGLGSDDPPDTQWVKLEKTDKKTGRKVKQNPTPGYKAAGFREYVQ